MKKYLPTIKNESVDFPAQTPFNFSNFVIKFLSNDTSYCSVRFPDFT
jgi:hypothetical protein